MMSGIARRAAITVPSTEKPSTRMTSWTSGSCGRITERFSASLSAGTTMLMSGFSVLRPRVPKYAVMLELTPMS